MHFSVIHSAALTLVASLTAPGSATWVQQCYSRLFDQRADPIISPGAVSKHVHVIAGGSGFNFTMDYTDARASTCSSCAIKEDLSNYWSPKMYYRAQNGSFITVPIEGDDGYGNMGGMAIYYLHRPGPDNDAIVPFPKGFRMVAGDPFKRSNGTDFASLAVNHRCIGTALQSNDLPNQKCPGGVRAQVTFPGCWDGVNLDSADHRSHVAYPADGNYDGGRCPSTHPKHIMTLFYEVTYRTDQFDDGWYGDSQPFVFAMGDPTGYGFHGDFFNGWDIPTLEKAITDCVDGATSCPNETFNFFTEAQTQACKLPNQIDEAVNGVLPELVGCNPVTTNEKVASKAYATCNDTTVIGVSSTAGKTDGWTYLGCGTDPIMNGGRTLTGPSKTDSTMTPEMCVSFCETEGYGYAGTEYSDECYCGNTIPSARAPKTGIYGNCNMACAGNATLMCGGNEALSLYQRSSKKAGRGVDRRGPGRKGGYQPDLKNPRAGDEPVVKREAGNVLGFHPGPEHNEPLGTGSGSEEDTSAILPRNAEPQLHHKHPSTDELPKLKAKAKPLWKGVSKRHAEADADAGRKGGFSSVGVHKIVATRLPVAKRDADAEAGKKGGFHSVDSHEVVATRLPQA